MHLLISLKLSVETYELLRAQATKEFLNNGGLRGASFSDEQRRSIKIIHCPDEPSGSQGVDGGNQDLREVLLPVVNVIRD